MQFEVPMEAQPQEILMYVFSRIIEFWPNALAVDSDDPEGYRRFEKSLGSLSIAGNRLTIYQNADALLIEELLSREAPSLQIDVEGSMVNVTAFGSSKEVIDHLSRLPLWSYKVTSNRLQAV